MDTTISKTPTKASSENLVATQPAGLGPSGTKTASKADDQGPSGTKVIPKKQLSGAQKKKHRELQKLRRGEGERGTGPAEGPAVTGAGPSTSNRSAPRIGTCKRYRSDGSTPPGTAAKGARPPPKKAKTTGTVKGTRSFSQAMAGYKMAFISEDPEGTLTAEEVELVKSWILGRIDANETGQHYPHFTECRSWAGALHIHCADQQSKEWLGAQLSQSKPWEGARLRFLDVKDLPKPVRAMVWIPGPVMKPESIFKRMEKQNAITTGEWRAVDRREDPKGQQLIVLMDQTSWDKMGKACDHRPYINFTRVKFRLLAKKKPEEGETGGTADPEKTTPTKEEEKMEVEGSQETPAPSTP